MARAVTIIGLAKLDKKLRKLPEAAMAKIRAEMERSAIEIVRLAKSLVAKDSHDLENSIGWTWGAPPRGSMTLGKVAKSALGKQLTLTIYAGDDRVYYARWVEFGTAPHPQGGKFNGTMHPGTVAHPFFFPAYRAYRKKAKAAIGKAIRESAKKVAAS